MTRAPAHESRDTTTAVARSTPARRFQWPRIFGYDFFVSFKLGPPPLGAQSYCSDLARRLRELDFTVFFSEEEAPPGAKLDDALVRALRRSRVLVVVLNEGALVHSTWVRKEVEEFRRLHPTRSVIPIVIDRAIERFGSVADTSTWLEEGRIWLDETPQAVEEGIASPAVIERLQVLQRFTRANTWFRWTVAAIIMTLVALTSWASYEAWDARRRFQEATAIRLSVEGTAITSGQRPGGSVRGLLQVLGSRKVVPSGNADEALQSEFLKFQRRTAIREVSHVIDSIAFSPDGRLIAVGSHDGHVQMWDAGTLTPIGEGWPAHGPISTIAFAAGSAQLVTGSVDGVLQQWDVASQSLLPAHPSMPASWFNWSVAVSNDGTRLAWGRESGDVLVWDVREPKPVAPLAGTAGVVGSPLALGFSRDARRIAYYSFTGQIGVLDTDLGGPPQGALVWRDTVAAGTPGFSPLENYGVRSGVVAFSPDGNRVVSGSTDGTLQWWDASSGRALASSTRAHDGGVTALSFSPDGRLLVSGGNDDRVTIWSTDGLNPLNSDETSHTAPVTALGFSADSRRFASASLDGTLHLWDVSPLNEWTKQVKTAGDDVMSVAFSAGDEPLVTGAYLRNMGGRRSDVFATSADGRRVVTRVGPNELWLTDPDTGKPMLQLEAQNVPVNNVMFSADGALLASIAGDSVLLWNVQFGRPLPTIHASQKGVNSLAILGDRIATGGQDGTIRLWSSATGRSVGAAIHAHTASVYGVAFDAEGNRLVSGSQDRTINVWDVATGTLLLGPIAGHQAGVRSVAFSPNGSRIVSGGGIPYEVPTQQARIDYSLRLWDAATGRAIGRPLRGHQHDVQSVAISADGNRVVSASLDGTIRVWAVFGAWADALCSKLARNPTPSEWREWVSPAIEYVCPCPGVGTESACSVGSPRR